MPKIPGISHKDAVRALEKAGFSVLRQSGHIVMGNGERRLTIPRGNPINAFTMGGVSRKMQDSPQRPSASSFECRLTHSGRLLSQEKVLSTPKAGRGWSGTKH
jgi:predicted RNA binding protein YcfA (HicA-like mRNA interferase family)